MRYLVILLTLLALFPYGASVQAQGQIGNVPGFQVNSLDCTLLPPGILAPGAGSPYLGLHAMGTPTLLQFPFSVAQGAQVLILGTVGTVQPDFTPFLGGAYNLTGNPAATIFTLLDLSTGPTTGVIFNSTFSVTTPPGFFFDFGIQMVAVGPQYPFGYKLSTPIEVQAF